MELTKLIARRAVQLIIVLLFVSFFTFLLVRLLPGDPTDVIIPFGTAAKKAELRSDLGLGKPFLNNTLITSTTFCTEISASSTPRVAQYQI